jgi:molecular chaperone HtpG
MRQVAQEKHSFQSEAAELLKMMINSVYSNRDIFLRELISNASDALDKRRIEVLSNDEYGEYEAKIHVRRDKENKTVAIVDNGIGMSREEIINYIGTIAKSGTKEFLAAAKGGDSQNDDSFSEMLIGQFGVGFYSAFMAADKVELISRRLGSGEAWKFESTGDGSYTIEESDISALPGCGTSVKLFLREPGEGEKDYSDEWTLRDIIKKYSDFISYPIVMNCKKWKDKQETVEDEVINSQKAIWCKAESDVSEDEYREFYRHLSHDWQEPLARVIINAEGTVNFRGVLFIPSQAPFDLVMNDRSGGISLYIKRVFIMNDCKNLIPEYLRFVKGVIDSEDLPLNISREILQDDQRIRVIRRSTLRKLFAGLRKLLENEREKYEKFWSNFGKVFKEGVVYDRENAQTMLELCLFHSTDSEWTTLDAYKGRMKPNQEGIYYLVGRDVPTLKSSPKLEAFAGKGYEVLLLPDPVDEVIMSSGLDYGDMKFLNVGGEAQAATEDERKEEAEKLGKMEAGFAPLKERIMSSLGEVLSDAKLSSRMKTSPACLVGDAGSMSPYMEQLMRVMGQNVPPSKRVLELNPEHPVVSRLMSLAGENDARVEDFVAVLYDQALLLDGGSVSDPGRFTRLLTDIMNSALSPETN